MEVQNKIVEDLLRLNSTVKPQQRITISNKEYTVTRVSTFEQEYDYNSEYSRLDMFLKNIVHSRELDFLDQAGIYISKSTNYEYKEEFIPFITLVTKHKGAVTISTNIPLLQM